VTFRRIAVVNRGEAAMRLIHAVRDLNAETGSTTQVVALHTEGERRAIAGSWRWVRNSPSASTSMKRRSKASPRAVSSASGRAMPRALLIG